MSRSISMGALELSSTRESRVVEAAGNTQAKWNLTDYTMRPSNHSVPLVTRHRHLWCNKAAESIQNRHYLFADIWFFLKGR